MVFLLATILTFVLQKSAKVYIDLIKKLKSVGMTLKKGKEKDGMMLAKVKEQDRIMLANVKVPSISLHQRLALLRRHATDKCGILFLYLLPL